MNQQPDEFIPTRRSLLSRLKNWDDQDSWREFFNTYWKLIYGVAIRAGLTEEEARDVVQETVVAVAKTMPEFKYDPAKCSFKTWLQHLTRKRIVDQYRRRDPVQARRAESPHDTARTDAIEAIADPASVNRDEVWEDEWHKNLFDAAIERVKVKADPKQYQLFYLYVMRQLPVQEVARSLRVNVAQVYLAKHRVSAMITKEVRRMEKKMAEGKKPSVVSDQ